MRGTVVHRFGPFELEPASRQLFRDQKRIHLSHPQSAILTHLVSYPGIVVSKEKLIETAWGGIPITPNSLDKAISKLRKVLSQGRGKSPTEKHYIETLPRHGYRFTAPVEQAERDGANVPLEAQLMPYEAFVQGRMELHTLDRDAIQRGRQAFEQALREAPSYAPAHIGLAMACGLAFDAAPDDTRDSATLAQGIRHAHTACLLAPASGEAWSTLAFVLRLNGQTRTATAAALKAMAVEPENWRQTLRAGYACWGEERHRAGHRVIALRPGTALAHWLVATVLVARRAFPRALAELRIGCAAQDAQVRGSDYPAVGLHLLLGLVLAAQDRLDAAVKEFQRELTWADSGQLYAQKCAANTWYALGAVYLRQQKRAEADVAFKRALAIYPRHVSAASVLNGKVPASARGFDAALGQAVVFARGGRHVDASRVYHDAVAQTSSGSTGWLLPVEPILNPLAHPDVWTPALVLIANRAL
jgi:DNA-binding winged helix-turn-helix (wHTH) protein/Flp pilus assembly protein TadD